MPSPTLRLESSNFGDYKHIEQDNDFTYDSGVAVCPVATRTAAHKIIRLHGGIGFRITRWSASRDGRPPIIPAYGNAGSDRILSATVTPSLPVIDPTNSAYNWTVSGEYIYVQNSPRLAGYNTFPVGQYPFPVLPQMNMASAMLEPYFAYYTGADPMQNLVETAAADIKFKQQYTWPILALPSVFSSTHIIGV